MLGARGVFTTHLPELAAMADTINAAVPGDSTAIGMVAGMRREERNGTPSGTYTVLPNPPHPLRPLPVATIVATASLQLRLYPQTSNAF